MTFTAIFLYLKRETQQDSKYFKKSELIVISCLAIITSLLAGFSGHFYINGDWAKHMAILYDLSHSAWPVYFHPPDIPDRVTQLIYYFGYYLTPAFLLKIFGSNFLFPILFTYSAFGLCLSFAWVYRSIGRTSIWLGIAFIFIGGLDLLGWLTIKKSLPEFATHIEWWAESQTQYPSVINIIFWVPQHALAAFIGWPLIRKFLGNKQYWGASLTLASLPLWSPFICVGLVPYVLYLLFKNKPKWIEVTPCSLYLGTLAIIYLSFYSSTSQSLNLNVTKHSEFILYIRMFYFSLIEFGVLAALVWFGWDQKARSERRNLFFIVIGTLFLIPFIHSTGWNDWAMRVSIPSLYILWIWFIENFTRKDLQISIRVSMALILLICLWSNLGEYQRSLDWASLESRHIWPFHSTMVDFYDGGGYQKQYFSDRPPSFFFKQAQ